MSLKISVITVCLNSEKTIPYTLNSVLSQRYKNIEHIIVDGGSTDNTINLIKKYPLKKKKIYLKKNFPLYKSLNFAIKKSTGKLISILHSDDIYNNENILNKVAKLTSNSDSKIFFGGVVFFKNENFSEIIRYYPAEISLKKNFYFGNMPPHTGSFYKKEIFEKYGSYKENFKIAADFEHLLRLIYINNEKFKIINQIVVRMKTGGISRKNFHSFITINNEILKSFKINGISSNIFQVLIRVPLKVAQYIFINKNFLNKNFRFNISKYYKDYFYKNIKIINKINSLNFNYNFVLSALNLAFLGSFSKNDIILYKELINWPDGLFSKIYKKKISKIPGRQVLENLDNLSFKKNIKRIIVLGNLSLNGKNYLKSKFRVELIHKKLPYGDLNTITKTLKLKMKKNDLLFITLPTPKQEQLANFIRKKNKYFKIVCIGGSIGIACGDEKEVPKFLFHVEFIWRLRYETFRRIKRLIITFYYFISDRLINKKIKDIKVSFLDGKKIHE